jgi:hypothetical protein
MTSQTENARAREKATQFLVDHDFDVDAYLQAGGELLDLPTHDTVPPPEFQGIARERIDRIVHFFQKAEVYYQSVRARKVSDLEMESELRRLWSKTQGPAKTVTPIPAARVGIIHNRTVRSEE